MGTFHKVAETKSLPSGEGMAVEVGGHNIALFNVDGTFYAVGGNCTHRGGPLSEGSLAGTTVTCPWHGANFDLTTGNVTGPPAPSEVRGYQVRVEGDEIQLAAL